MTGRIFFDFDPIIEIQRPFEDVVSAVWHALTASLLAQDDDVSAHVGESLPGVVEFILDHERAGEPWGRLVVRRQGERLTAFHALGPAFLQEPLPADIPSEDLPAARKAARAADRRRHDWRVSLWAAAVSDVVESLQEEFRAVDDGLKVGPMKRPEPPTKPTEKGKDSLDAWFRWYHDMKRGNFKVKLQDVADGSGFALQTIKDRHALWKTDKDDY